MHVPGQVTGTRLPSILKVEVIRATIFLTVKFLADERAGWWIVERIRSVLNPTSFIPVAITLLPFCRLPDVLLRCRGLQSLWWGRKTKTGKCDKDGKKDTRGSSSPRIHHCEESEEKGREGEREREREREVAKVAGDIVLSVFFINMAGFWSVCYIFNQFSFLLYVY